MSILLDFQFLVVLNLLVCLVWPASVPYRTTLNNAISIIVLILTILAVLFDIVFLVLKVFVH
jgi:hypothetical protein